MNKARSAPRWTWSAPLAALALGATIATAAAAPPAAWPYATANLWGSAGGGYANARYAPLEWRLNPRSVGRLQLAWSFTTTGLVSTAPTVEGKALYLADWGGMLYRLDTDTGNAVWSRKISAWTGNAKSFSRNSPAIGPDSIVFGDHLSSYVMAVDKRSGELLWKTQLDTQPNANITSSPVIVGNRVYVGVSSNEESQSAANHQFSFRGSVVALNLHTGAVQWRFRTVPDGYSGAAVWGGLSIDPLKRRLYASTGNNYSLPAAVSACVQQAGNDKTAQTACLAPNDYVDAVLALNLDTGALLWSRRLQGVDTWISLCLLSLTTLPCPDPAGLDYDFSGAGTNLFTVLRKGKLQQLVGAGQKSGIYWALDADTGQSVWSAQVGPGSVLSGGIQWGVAVDPFQSRIYVAINNGEHVPYLLAPDYVQSWNAGSWAALDAASGKILWQVAVPGQEPGATEYGAGGLGPLTASPGVVYAGSAAGDLVALDAGSGATLWHYANPGSVASGPAVVDGALYWGTGYYAPLITNNKLYKFALPAR